MKIFLQPMIPPKRFDISPPVWDAQKVYMRSDFSLNSLAAVRMVVLALIVFFMSPSRRRVFGFDVRK